MQRNFICLINPISGTKNKSGVLKIIENKLSAARYPFQLIHTNKEADYFYLKEKIKTESITDIIICGGDGSVSQVTGSLLGEAVAFGIIPMGSGNGLARTAGIPSNAAKAIDIILAGKSTLIDAFYINKKFSCMLAGLGMDAQVAHDFAKQSTRGLSTYIKQTILGFFNAPAFPFKITIGEKTLSTEAYFLSIANSNQFGNNVTIAPQASLSDGLLDIVVVNKMNKASMIYNVLKHIKFGKPISFTKTQETKKEVMYFQTDHLTITNVGNAPLHIDGEPEVTSKHFEIKIVEKAFRLLMP
ncbi:MAG: YegS/Rv2252/BmrU family lipid kinase [Ferruginibacter sp.]